MARVSCSTWPAGAFSPSSGCEAGAAAASTRARPASLAAYSAASARTSSAGSADIHVSPDGKFLYASNRAEANTIAIFSINQTNGKLALVGHQSTLGKTPRNFNFDPTGNFLLVANQNSDAIVVFKINKDTGLLTDTGNRIDVGKPVCLKWISMQ